MSGGLMYGGRMSDGRLSGGLMSGGLMSAHPSTHIIMQNVKYHQTVETRHKR